MSMSDRDKKIIVILVPIVAVLAFWFLVLSPKRSEATKLGTQLEQAQSKRDSTVAQAAALQGSRNNYAKDYATVVRLGKAIPSTVDMPSLLVQLDSAAKGTKIDFNEVKAGDRTTATTATSTSTGGAAGSSSGSGSAPVAPGGDKAQTGSGTATESANNTQQSSNSTSAASGADAGTTSSTSGSSSTGTTGSGAQGLDSVPLTFAFSGSFFDLADFFHSLKRFVRAADGNVDVKGRLMTIDNLSFKSDSFPAISATVNATVYLSPKSEGTTAGATSQGPQATPASTPTPTATSQNTSATSGQGNPQ